MTTGRIGPAGPAITSQDAAPGEANWTSAARPGAAPGSAEARNPALQGLDPHGPELANNILTMAFGQQHPGAAHGAGPKAQPGTRGGPHGAKDRGLLGTDLNVPKLVNTVLTTVLGKPQPATTPGMASPAFSRGSTNPGSTAPSGLQTGAGNQVLRGLDPNGPALANNILTMAFSGEQPGPAGSTERSNAMATGPIGAPGPGATPQINPTGREDWASAHSAAQAGGPGNSEFAPGHDKSGPGNSEFAPGHNKSGPATPGPGPIQGLIGTGTDLATNILNLVFGAQPAQALGMPPEAHAALAAAKPWQVASMLLGAPGSLDAAAFAKLEAMPGPLAELLRAGAEPRAALAVQEHWLALNGKIEDQTGLSTLPMAQPSVWANSAGDARAILGTTPRAVPPEAMDKVMAALGEPRATPLVNHAATREPGIMALGVAPAATDTPRPAPLPANATAVVAVPERTPVAVSREVADQIAVPASIPLGAGLTMQHDPVSGAVIIGFEAAGASQVLGPLAPPIAAALAPALAETLAGTQGAPRGIDISVSMTLGADGAPTSFAVSGSVTLADGTVKPFGAAPDLAAPHGGPTATPQEMPATAVLHLAGGAAAGGDSLTALLGPYVEYMRPTPVPLDLATGPGADALPNDTRLWRMDDTRIFVALRTQGATEALLEASRLHRAAVTGALALDELPPGAGFETWDGSLLSLSLAGIRKTSVAAAEETPPRVQALHLDNDTWRASRGGREISAATAGEDLRLFLAYGLDPALAAGKGPQGGLAEQARAGFADALLQMEQVRLAWWLPPGEMARRQETWAGVAREWAATLAGLDAAGLPVLPEGVPPVAALLGIAARQGSAAAWATFQASGLDLAWLLDAAGSDRAALSEALAAGALLAAGQLGVPADRAAGSGADPTDLVLAAAREAFLHAMVATERGTLPREALEAALDAYGQAALAHLTEGDPLAHGDQGALAARLGHAAQTDIERGYLAPYLRIGRPADGAPESDQQAWRQAGG